MSFQHQNTADQLEYESSQIEHNSVNLKRRYPISMRYPLMIALPWFGALIGLSILFASADIWIKLFQPQLEFLYQYYFEAWIVIFAVSIVLLCKITYGVLYANSYTYLIQGDVFSISRGVILKRRVSISLAREPDVYVGRRWRHFLLGLYYVEVVTPASRNNSFIRVDGLLKDTAYALQQYLVQKINSPHLAYSPRTHIYDQHDSLRNHQFMH